MSTEKIVKEKEGKGDATLFKEKGDATLFR